MATKTAKVADAQQGFFLGDPALIQVQGSVAQALAFAESEALRRQRELLIDYGDPSLAQQLLKEGANGPDVLAAQRNPFSTRQQINRQHEHRQRDLNESLNQRNLFYSSTRERALGDEGLATLQQYYDAARQVQSQLSDINTSLMQARLTAQAQREQAIQDARNQRVQRVLGG